MRVLLTTTSYQDTPGPHHQALAESGLEVVRERGPIHEERMLERVGEGFDGLLNGDDEITARVIDAALPRLKVISKYGIGLDSIAVTHATKRGLPVLFTPGVNHTTVAEHALGLIIAVSRHLWPRTRDVKEGRWKRSTGTELDGKTIGVLGMGRIGKEVIKRARAFGMRPVAYDVVWDEAFAEKCGVERAESPAAVFQQADVISLHLTLTEETRHLVDADQIAAMKDGAILINTARGGLVDEAAVAEACRSGKLAGYGADVLEEEPIRPPHPFQEIDNVVITPHVGSRTVESVQRQAMRATHNLVNYLTGGSDYIQANL